MKDSNFDQFTVETFSRHIRVISIFVLVFFGALLLRLWFLQVVNGSHYRKRSEDNRIRLHDITPFRGLIMDRNGETLVDNRPTFDLYVIPEEVPDDEILLKRLNRFVNLDLKEAGRKLAEFSRRCPFREICLKRDMSRDELAAIETHRFNLPGVFVRVKPQRHYIRGDLASHVLGYLGEISEDQLRSGAYKDCRSGDQVGKSGIELKWQSHLNGKRGGEQVEVDAAGRRIRVVSSRLPTPGFNICLTIDRELQQRAEECLEGKKGAIVALDPNNGQVLALASSPSFDPNMFVGGIDRKSWIQIATSRDFPLQNRCLAGQYPPGSVFKIVVALAALEEGLVEPEEEIFCNGSYRLGRRVYRCWKKYGHGKVDLHRALVESCDVYFYNLGRRLGVDKIADYARRCGLGESSGFDAVAEKAGLVPSSKWKIEKLGVPWQGGETVSLAIGQSFLLVTPIQIAAMMSAIFNGGTLYTPQATLWVGRDEGSKMLDFSPKVKQRLEISPENLELVKAALVGVVNEPHGTGGRARFKEFRVAGKTGTAQVVTLEKEKEYGDGSAVPVHFRDHAWFAAIAPADSPGIALAVVVEHGGHGGSTSAPIARELIDVYLGSRQDPSRYH